MWWQTRRNQISSFGETDESIYIGGGRQFSRLPAAEVCASAVLMLDTPCSDVVWRVLATHSIRQFPLHFPSRASPCAIAFQLDSTTFHVHTPATYAFRTMGRFNPANGVNRELPVSWLAVGWRHALLSLVMKGCDMPMVWAAIFPDSSTYETLATQKCKYLITAEGQWIHASPPMRPECQPRTKGHPKIPYCVDPMYWLSNTLDWYGSPNASRGLSQKHDGNPPRATWFLPSVRIANPRVKTWVRFTTLFLFRRGAP